MSEHKARSSPAKKGLSLSLGKRGVSPIKQSNNPHYIQNVSIPIQHWHIFPPSQRKIINHPFPLKPQTVIYRFDKSQWEKLQQKNRHKRQIVNKMKSELQFLNQEVKQVEYKQIPIFQSHYKVSVLSPMKNPKENKKQNLTVQNSKIINFNTSFANLQTKSNNIKSSYIPNKQTIQSKDNTYCIKVIQPVEVRSDHEVFNNMKVKVKQIQTTDKQNSKSTFCLLSHKKSQFNSKRNLIDINALADIENRLTRLIDQTNF